MTDRSGRSGESDQSVRGWLIDGVAFELRSLLIAVPLLVAVGLAAWALSWSFRQAAIGFVGAAVVWRAVMWIIAAARR